MLFVPPEPPVLATVSSVPPPAIPAAAVASRPGQLPSGIAAPETMVIAQAVVPANDGTGTQVTPNGNQLDVGGGTRSADGANLFHSFEQLRLSPEQILNFQSNPAIRNILGRIVGGNPAVIDGLLQITGGASNLFLMNPAGIIFGPNAQLNLPAAFTATTATGIGFDNGWLNANGPNAYANLMGNPQQFQFATLQPGAIANFGRLVVRPGQLLQVLAGTILNLGELAAPDGELRMMTVPGTSLVRLTPTGAVLSLEVPLDATEWQPLTLPQLLTGSGIGSATGVTVQPDGVVQLNGSGLPVQGGDLVVQTATAGRADLSATGNLILPSGQLRTTGDGVLAANQAVQVRDSAANPLRLQTGGGLTLQGQTIEVLALQHPASVLQSGGDLRLRSPNPVIGDGRFRVGGSFRVEQPNGLLGSLGSPGDPTFEVGGDFSQGDYTGASLQILAGGSVTLGNVTLTAAGAPFTNSTLTLSDGTALTISGTTQPTLEVRAGTTQFLGAPLPGTPTSADITVGTITIQRSTFPGGLIVLTNQAAPNLALPGGAVQVGNIDASGSLRGGDVVVDARGPATVGAITTSVTTAGGAIAGFVKLLTGQDLVFNSINTQATELSVGAATSGAVTLQAGGTVRGLGAGTTINTQALAFGGAGGGAVTIRHDGGVTNAPFRIGDASVNGTAGSIQTTGVTSPIGDQFPNPGIETRGAAPAQTGLTVNFVNTPPTLTVSQGLNALTNQTTTFRLADLNPAIADVNNDLTSLQIAAVSAGTLTRNGVALQAGDTVSVTDVLVYTPPSNAVGTLTAFELQASDRVSRSAPVAVGITVTASPLTPPIIPTIGSPSGAPPPAPPQAAPPPPIPFTQVLSQQLWLGAPLKQSALLTPLVVIRGILPEAPYLFLGFGSQPQVTYSLPLQPGGPNPFGFIPVGGGTTTLPMIIMPPGGPNPGFVSPGGPGAGGTSSPGTPGSPSPGTPGTGAPDGSPSTGTPGGTPSGSSGQTLAAVPGGQTQVPIGQPLQSCQAQVRTVQESSDRTQTSYSQLLDCYQQALESAKAGGDRTVELYTLNNLATAAFVVGDYLKAMAYHQQQLTLAQQVKDPVGEGMARSGIGAAYGALGDYAQAIEHYTRALNLLTVTTAPQWRALTLRNLGNAYLNQRDPRQAMRYQQASLEISRQIGDRYGEAQALGNLGNAQALLGDFAAAIAAQQQSLKLAQAIGDRLQEAQALLSLGTAYAYQRNYSTAVTYHQQSLVLVRELQARLGEGIALNNLGDALFRLQRLIEAETALTDGVAVWETLRAGLGNNDAFKVSIFETQADTYRNLQEVLVAQNKSLAALEMAERGRARAFVELLARGNQALTTRSLAPLSLEQIRQTAIAHKATLVEYTIVRDQVAETPHSASVQFTATPRDVALFIWVVQPTGAVTFRRVDLTGQVTLPPLAELVATARTDAGIRGGIGVQSGSSGVVRQGQQSAWQRLSQLLIAPIADLLPTDPQARVIFVPQEQLFLVPFAALPDANGRPLIERHTILTTPAIQVLQATQAPTQAAANGQNALIVGNPSPLPNNLAPLPYAETEAQQIGQLLGAVPLLGTAATETAVKQRLPTAGVIHFATHGLLNEANPLQGAIALAPSGQQDGLLTAAELLNQPLNAQLVVLSACDTGRGKITGDGVLGLARSLMAAGTPSVIVSLWQVPDAPTANLMVEFYRGRAQKLDKAAALRQAMLTTMQRYPDPVNWAAFTLVGEPD